MKKTLLFPVLMTLGIASAQAAIVLRTGVDNNGAVMAPGSIDTDWEIKTPNSSDYTSTKVLYPLINPNNLNSGGQICCGMETVAGTAAWISDLSVNSTTPNTQWGVGQDVRIRTRFDLTGYDLSTVALTGNWRIADYTRGVFLNGIFLPGSDFGGITPSASNGTWFSNHPFSFTSGFNAGINTLEFLANSHNTAWDGLWVDATVTGRQTGGGQVPLPGTFSLLTLALIGLGTTLRRRS